MTNYQHVPSLDELSNTLAEFSGTIKDPVAKLKFTQRVLERYAKTARVKKLPGFEAVTCRKIVLEELKTLATSSQIDLDNAHLSVRLQVAPGRNLPAIGLVAAWLLILVFASYTTHSLVQGACKSHAASVAHLSGSVNNAAAAGPDSAQAVALDRALTAHQAEKDPSAIRSHQEVWLVEKRPGYEFYSNGLRILTEHEAEAQPREYYIFRRAGPLPSTVETRPVGLLYHTSEGDIFPLSSRYNRLLIETTRQLLVYVKVNRLYNYVIDRFGRVYRVVKDHHTAYHAGFSIWSNDAAVYINLNPSFIGICFEGRWTEPELALPAAQRRSGPATITSAQTHAARLLTDWLRQTYQIPDRNCVTHGLTSVNPKKFLIGHHVDWIRNFPFSELGLTDKYRLPLPSIAEFGFSYDDYFLETLGEPLPGAERAITQLKARAAQDHVSYESLRARLRRDYEKKLAWLKERPTWVRESAEAGKPSGKDESLN